MGVIVSLNMICVWLLLWLLLLTHVVRWCGGVVVWYPPARLFMPVRMRVHRVGKRPCVCICVAGKKSGRLI